MKNYCIPFLCLGLFAVCGYGQSGTVRVRPGDDIQKLVNANPEGATFWFTPGVYRLAQIVPRNGNRFIGNGATLNGSWQLTKFEKVGRVWAVSGQTQHGTVHGSCQPARPRCGYPEDLYFDDVPLPQAQSIAEVSPGQWYFDYSAETIYLGSNPSGHKVEIGTRPFAFTGPASNVRIEDFHIEKYANPAQSAAVNPTGKAPGWLIRKNEICLNHGWGLRIGSGMTVVENFIHDNGQLGIGGSGEDIVVEGNEVSKNNYAGFEAGWEAGGAKFFATTNLLVRRNVVHGNFGTGLWTDTDNRNTRYELNRVFDNIGPGIQHEISFGAVIAQNKVMNNGRGGSPWLWGAQILVQNSSDVEVTENYVEVLNSVGNGIALVQQSRDKYVTRNNYVHGNTIVYRGANGHSGAVADHDGPGLFGGSNRFDSNVYYGAKPGDARWAWKDSFQTWDTFKRMGQERGGKVDSARPPSQTALGSGAVGSYATGQNR